MRSRAYRVLELPQFGAASNFRLAERVLKPPSGTEVSVRVSGCAIAYRDVIDRTGGFKFAKLPAVLGHEVSGVVTEAAAGATWAVGDRLVSLHWDQTVAWPSPLENPAARETMVGLTIEGGYGEYVTAPSGCFARAPDESYLPLADASCLFSTYGTVWWGLKRIACKDGARVLITGASGGVGTAAIQICRARGFTVDGVTSNPTKAAHLTSNGCHNVVMATEGKFKTPAASKYDVVVETVGGPTFGSSLYAVKAGGTVLLIGNVTNAVVNLPLGKCIVNSISVVGTDSIPKDAFEKELIPFLVKHRIRPVIAKRVNVNQVVEVHTQLEKHQLSGRVILDWQ